MSLFFETCDGIHLQPYRVYKPNVSASEAPRKWWKYLIKATIYEIRCHKNASIMKDLHIVNQNLLSQIEDKLIATVNTEQFNENGENIGNDPESQQGEESVNETAMKFLQNEITKLREENDRLRNLLSDALLGPGPSPDNTSLKTKGKVPTKSLRSKSYSSKGSSFKTSFRKDNSPKQNRKTLQPNMIASGSMDSAENEQILASMRLMGLDTHSICEEEEDEETQFLFPQIPLEEMFVNSSTAETTTNAPEDIELVPPSSETSILTELPDLLQMDGMSLCSNEASEVVVAFSLPSPLIDDIDNSDNVNDDTNDTSPNTNTTNPETQCIPSPPSHPRASNINTIRRPTKRTTVAAIPVNGRGTYLYDRSVLSPYCIQHSSPQAPQHRQTIDRPSHRVSNLVKKETSQPPIEHNHNSDNSCDSISPPPVPPFSFPFPDNTSTAVNESSDDRSPSGSEAAPPVVSPPRPRQLQFPALEVAKTPPQKTVVDMIIRARKIAYGKRGMTSPRQYLKELSPTEIALVNSPLAQPVAPHRRNQRNSSPNRQRPNHVQSAAKSP